MIVAEEDSDFTVTHQGKEILMITKNNRNMERMKECRTSVKF